MRILKPLPGALPVPERNIVGDWPMNGLGEIFYDSSGNRHNMSVGGGTPAWSTKGKFGPAILFNDASAEYLIVNSMPVVSYPYTIVCWFNTDQFANQSLVLFGDTDDLWYEGIWIRDPVDNDIIAHTFGASSVFAKTSTNYSLNKWHQAAGVFAATNDRRVYIDGGSEGLENSNVARPSTLDNLLVGARLKNGSLDLYFSGMVDIVTIYNQALSPSVIARLYRESFYRYPENRIFAVV